MLCCVFVAACGPDFNPLVPTDPCPGQQQCGSSCIDLSDSCCSSSTGAYCLSGKYCSAGDRCTDNGFVSCNYTTGFPDGYECPIALGCSSVVGYCNP